MPIAQLDRSVFRLSGKAVTAWLEGLITNTLNDKMNFAALLTPQGKIIADFFVTKTDAGLLLDTPPEFSADLFKRLKLYRLRAPIVIEELTQDYNVYALWEGEGQGGLEDPRHAHIGQRLITQDYLETAGSIADYDLHRLSLGVVDSAWDFKTAARFPADANMDLMHGVDFKKGCFIGQEVVSRMKRMTTVKKRMRSVKLSGPAKSGDSINASTRLIGEILHVHEAGKIGMALVRLDRLKAAETAPDVQGHKVEIFGSLDGSE